jgi:hypothetical protein
MNIHTYLQDDQPYIHTYIYGYFMNIRNMYYDMLLSLTSNGRPALNGEFKFVVPFFLSSRGPSKTTTTGPLSTVGSGEWRVATGGLVHLFSCLLLDGIRPHPQRPDTYHTFDTLCLKWTKTPPSRDNVQHQSQSQ